MILGIEYDMHWYITTGLLPFEEYSEEQLWTDVEEWRALTSRARQEVESWERRGIEDRREGLDRRIYLG